MESISIQIASDLHLEFANWGFDMLLKPAADPLLSSNGKYPAGGSRYADILALVGDIGDPWQNHYPEFLTQCAEEFKHVLVIAGNHEFYNREHTFPESVARMKKIAKAWHNVHFLHRDAFQVPGTNVVILGCVLWSHLPSAIWSEVRGKLADFRILYRRKVKRRAGKEGRPAVLFTPDIYNHEHRTDKEWLQGQLEGIRGSAEGHGIRASAVSIRAAEGILDSGAAEGMPSDRRVVVLTHHAPSFDLRGDKYPESSFRHCFHSECDELIGPPVVLWAFGHTHENVDQIINGVRCLCNCGGYADEVTGYQKSCVCIIRRDPLRVRNGKDVHK